MINIDGNDFYDYFAYFLISIDACKPSKADKNIDTMLNNDAIITQGFHDLKITLILYFVFKNVINFGSKIFFLRIGRWTPSRPCYITWQILIAKSFFGGQLTFF